MAVNQLKLFYPYSNCVFAFQYVMDTTDLMWLYVVHSPYSTDSVQLYVHFAASAGWPSVYPSLSCYCCSLTQSNDCGGFGKCTRPRQQRGILFGITFYCSVEERCKVLTLFFLFFFKQILGIARCLGWGLAIVPSQTLAITLSQTTCWAVYYMSLISCHPIETLHYHIPSIRKWRCCMKTAIALLTLCCFRGCVPNFESMFGNVNSEGEKSFFWPKDEVAQKKVEGWTSTCPSDSDTGATTVQ